MKHTIFLVLVLFAMISNGTKAQTLSVNDAKITIVGDSQSSGHIGIDLTEAGNCTALAFKMVFPSDIYGADIVESDGLSHELYVYEDKYMFISDDNLKFKESMELMAMSIKSSFDADGSYSCRITDIELATTDFQLITLPDVLFTVNVDNLNAGSAVHDYVDLGLPSGTLWATCNVGADSPEEYGWQYAWGETETKEYYSLEAYKWYDDKQCCFTKYCTDSDYGIVDNKTELDPEDDVAHVKWGGSWRMPTIDEIAELRNLCTWEWTVLNGIYGCRVTGKNGNSIFLPAAGYSVDELLSNATNEMAYYYSSSLTADYPECAEILAFWDVNLVYGANLRYYGRAVRPVMSSKEVDPSVQPDAEYVDLGLPSGTLWAKRNVGAASTGDGGYHLAWGEVYPKEVYNWGTYFDTWDGGNSFVEYNASNGNRELKPEHDAAYYHFGSNWKTPGYNDLMELRDKCTWELSEEDGNEGFRITGPNGNSIFLPAAGLGVDGRIEYAGELGDYWANTRANYSEDYADGMGFLTDQGVYSYGAVRYYGECVRPIFVGNPSNPDREHVVSINILNPTSIIKYGESIQFRTVVLPMNASNKLLSWTSDDTSVATVSANGTVTAVGMGSAVITASATDGSNVKAKCIVNVQSEDGVTDVMINGDCEGIFTLDGRKVETMQNGIYIVLTKDGSARIVRFK